MFKTAFFNVDFITFAHFLPYINRRVLLNTKHQSLIHLTTKNTRNLLTCTILHHFAAKIQAKPAKSTPKHVQVPANEDIAASCTKHKKVLFLNLQETHLQVLHLQELATLFLAYVRAR